MKTKSYSKKIKAKPINNESIKIPMDYKKKKKLRKNKNGWLKNFYRKT